MKSWLFPSLSAINGSPVHLPPRKCEKEQPSTFLFLLSLSLQAREKTSRSDFLSLWIDVGRGSSYYNIIAPLLCKFPLCFLERDVRAKHANCSVFGWTDEHKTLLESQPQRRREQWICWFIITLLPHRSNIIMSFLSQPFTFTDINNCLYNSCVFNINLCIWPFKCIKTWNRTYKLVSYSHATCQLLSVRVPMCFTKCKKQVNVIRCPLKQLLLCCFPLHS